MQSLDPFFLRQAILILVAIPIVLGWSVSLIVWVVNGDFSGLTITTPLVLLLLTFATGYRVTKKVEDE